MNSINDVLIVGAGPAGLSAAIYLVRAGYKVDLYEKGVPGGKVNLTAHVGNYPSYNDISGPDLAMKFYEHASSLGIACQFKEVTSIEKKNDLFEVKCGDEVKLYRAVIVCTGTREKDLPAINAEHYLNHGISYCAVCDGRFFKDQPVAVVGGGDSALEEALYLTTICSNVYLIHRRDEFRASDFLIKKVLDSSISLLLDSTIEEVMGDNKVESIKVKNVKNNKVQIIDVNAIFPYIGAIPNTSFIVNNEVKDEKGYLIVDNNFETKEKGLFACGDVLKKELRQIVTASSDGANAAINVAKYLKGE